VLIVSLLSSAWGARSPEPCAQSRAAASGGNRRDAGSPVRLPRSARDVARPRAVGTACCMGFVLGVIVGVLLAIFLLIWLVFDLIF
jgi:hypothetical protein